MSDHKALDEAKRMILQYEQLNNELRLELENAKTVKEDERARRKDAEAKLELRVAMVEVLRESLRIIGIQADRLRLG